MNAIRLFQLFQMVSIFGSREERESPGLCVALLRNLPCPREHVFQIQSVSFERIVTGVKNAKSYGKRFQLWFVFPTMTEIRPLHIPGKACIGEC